jgi:large subunit ribosomal protein L31e
MATKKESQPKIVLEREYNIPLRRKYLLVPKYKRAKKAIKTIHDFLSKHMKSDNVKLGRYLNLEIWKDGIRSPPHHISVIVKKDEEGIVTAELKGAPVIKKEEKSETKVKSDKENSEEKSEIKDAEIIEEKVEKSKPVKDASKVETKNLEKKETKPKSDKSTESKPASK